MKLVVFGATGGTGQHVVAQALADGHAVTAVVRTPEALAALHNDRLAVVRGDVMDAASIAPALQDADAVASALGPRGRGPTTICSAGTIAIVRAMAMQGVRRLVCVSAVPVEDDPALGLVTRYIIRPLFRNTYADLRRMEAAVRRSETEWTIVRPPRLTNGPHTGTYRVAVDGIPPRAAKISRADLADALLRALSEGAYSRRVIAVAD